MGKSAMRPTKKAKPRSTPEMRNSQVIGEKNKRLSLKSIEFALACSGMFSIKALTHHFFCPVLRIVFKAVIENRLIMSTLERAQEFRGRPLPCFVSVEVAPNKIEIPITSFCLHSSRRPVKER
jgi:hypothetical protein